MTKPNAKLFIGLALTAILAIMVIFEYVVPLCAGYYFADDFKQLALECDLAMHDEAALRSGTPGARKAPMLTESAEVGLIACHDYDKLRKRMLALGVSPDKLSLYSIEALENEKIPVSRMIEAHKMERF